VSKIILIGCGKTKRQERSAAAELYTGSLFRARLAYAQASGCPWWIISAKYGLVDPFQLIGPYDLTIADLPILERAVWGLDVVHAIIDRLPDSIQTAQDLRKVTVEIHAGADYADLLAGMVVVAGMTEARPMRGMSQGAQMAAYKSHRITKASK
jgi:hypothetical protein